MKKILLVMLALSATALLSAAAGDAKELYDKGCAKCHEPPSYTNNRLVRAGEWNVPADHPDRDRVMTATVDTDPSLAQLTRKGTGFYSVPSLRGVWYRGLFEHSGSVKTLEDWFDPKRLQPKEDLILN